VNDIRALILDVDAVLTDGRIFVCDDGRQSRAFHVHDGFAIRWFQKLGGIVILCSGKRSDAVAARAAELGIERVIQGSEDKLRDVEAALANAGLRLTQAAVVGDDLPDVPLMRACGYAIAVANAVEEARRAARYCTSRAGGCGAVREAIEHLLRRDGRWEQVLARYDCSRDQARASRRMGDSSSLRSSE
jgi:3-deoxy-D-manno-octulosonate 8-phosphate phosphatase (KDO 8-P phosphatase)